MSFYLTHGKATEMVSIKLCVASAGRTLKWWTVNVSFTSATNWTGLTIPVLYIRRANVTFILWWNCDPLEFVGSGLVPSMTYVVASARQFWMVWWDLKQIWNSLKKLVRICPGLLTGWGRIVLHGRYVSPHSIVTDLYNYFNGRLHPKCNILHVFCFHNMWAWFWFDFLLFSNRKYNCLKKKSG